MIELLPESSDNCIGIKLTGEIAAADYDELLPKLDAAIEAQGQINLLVVVEELHGWEDREARKADLGFGKDQYKNVTRCAYISDKKWHKWVVKAMAPFTRGTKEKFFNPVEIDEAWAWAQGG